MLYQVCKKKDALVHLFTGATPKERRRKTKSFCKECADAHYVRTGMNSRVDKLEPKK